MVWSGRGWGGGGGLAWRKRAGAGAATGWWSGAGGFASRIPYNVARAPVLINLNLYFKPYTQP